MLTSRRDSSQSGLTRIELLVLVVVLVILGGVSFGPILSHLEEVEINHALEKARTINTLLSQYATDNNGVYPVGLDTSAVGKSEGIARNLLENNYTPAAALFAIGSTPKYGGTASDFSDIAAVNISWDFTAGATASTSITSAAPDLLPTVYSTGETVIYPASEGAGFDLPLSGNGPFGKSGVIVAYKAGNAIFIRATPSGTTLECRGFIPTSFKETGPYTQIKP